MTDPADSLDPTQTIPARLAEAAADESRRHDRRAHPQPVRVQLFDPEGRMEDQGWAQLVDVSPSGARLQGLRLYRQTEITDLHRIGLTIVMDDGRHFVQTSCMPRWADDSGDIGVEFDQVDVHVA